MRLSRFASTSRVQRHPHSATDSVGACATRLLLPIYLAFAQLGYAQVTLTNIDVPGATQTVPIAISNNGTVVGYFYNGSFQCFTWSAGTFQVIAGPNSPYGCTSAVINNQGDVAGTYTDSNLKSHGWISQGRVLTTIDAPTASGEASVYSAIGAINDSGQALVTGNYPGSPSYFTLGFLYDLQSGTFTQLPVIPLPPNVGTGSCTPLAGFTFNALNNLNEVAGTCSVGTRNVIYSLNYLTDVALFTQAPTPAPPQGFGVTGINDSHLIIGGIYNGAPYSTLLYSLASGQVIPVTPPTGSNFYLTGINNAGNMVGTYEDASGVYHGVLVSGAISSPTPSVPATTLGAGSTATNPTVSIAEPINTATGNFYTVETDLAVPSRGLPFVFDRYYNSLDPTTGPLGVGWTHTYNASLAVGANGNVTVRQQDGSAVIFAATAGGTFAPSTPGLHDSLTQNPDGSFTLTRRDKLTLRFSSLGKLEAVSDRNGNTQTLQYSTTGDLASLTDTVGRSFQFTYDANHHLISLQDFAGRIVLYGYDSSGHLISATDPAGNTESFAYDSLGRITNATDANGVTYVANTYDSVGRVTAQTNALNVTTRLAYNTPTPGTCTVTDGNGNILRYVYDSSYRLTQFVDGNGDITSFAYDSNNNRTSITDANGHKLNFVFDNAGRLLSATNAAGGTYGFTFDSDTNLVATTDPGGHKSTARYDSHGNVVAFVDLQGNSTTVTYDAFGEPIAVSDATGKASAYKWNARGNLIAASDGAGRSQTYAYDSLGRLVTLTDGASGHWWFAYDAVNHLIARTDPLNDSTTYTYDAVGRLVKVANALNDSTAYTYDKGGNLASMIDALGNVTRYDWDGNNNLVQATDAKGYATVYDYDSANRLTRITDALGRSRSATYDPVGAIVTTTDARGNPTTRAYDELERLISVVYADGRTVRFQYDAVGNRVGMVDSFGTAAYAYDEMHRLIRVQRDPSALSNSTINYGYDKAGRRTYVKFAKGGEIVRTYDGSGRLIAITDLLGNTTRFSYDKAGRRIRTDFANGVMSEYSFDAAGRLLSIRTAHDQETIAHSAFQLDALGNRLQVDSEIGSKSYSYDALGRLVSATDLRGSTRFEYDAVGNRLTLAKDGHKLSYLYDAADELLQVDSTLYRYDADGNLLSRSVANHADTFTWDAAGRLASVAIGDRVTGYTYDGLGRRLTKTVGKSTDSFLYDEALRIPDLLALRPSSEADGGRGSDGNDDSSRAEVFVRGVGGIIAVDPYGGNGPVRDPEYLHIDPVGSVVAVTNASGNIKETISYTPFGEQTIEGARTRARAWNSADENLKIPYGFAGQVHDLSDGLVYMKARYYDPKVGRFISRDPRSPQKFDPLDRNPYAYALNNPLRFNDPTGLAASRGRALIRDALAVGGGAGTSQAVGNTFGAIALGTLGVAGVGVAGTVTLGGLSIAAGATTALLGAAVGSETAVLAGGIAVAAGLTAAPIVLAVGIGAAALIYTGAEIAAVACESYPVACGGATQFAVNQIPGSPGPGAPGPFDSAAAEFVFGSNVVDAGCGIVDCSINFNSGSSGSSDSSGSAGSDTSGSAGSDTSSGDDDPDDDDE